jgi:hypothetical protein
MISSRQSGSGIYHEVKQIIVEHDPVFAALENEKRLGWESKDVERLWKLRTDKLNLLNQTSRRLRESRQQSSKGENPFEALANSSDESDSVEPESNLSVTGNKLIRAGKGPSYDKYYDFYRRLFTSATEHRDIFQSGSRRFMDIGCAPGGLCAYFIRDLGWSGVGFTLQIERGGLRVRFKDQALQVHPCDMSEMESVAFITEKVSNMPKFNFINCGVVMGKHQVESIGEDRETALQILRVNRNQFLAALKHLAEGGDLFWVFQSSSIGCWFYFLKMLQSVFRKKISLYSTLVPSRSPVYAICSDFDANAARRWIALLESTTEFTDEHIRSWNVTTWEEAGPLIASLRDDLYKIWNTQREGLKEIREAASSQLAQEELLLKKLSGSRTGQGAGASSEPNSAHSSFTQRRGRNSMDDDADWRKKPVAPAVRGLDEEGWETAKPSSHQSSKFHNRKAKPGPKRPAEIDDSNWRR